MVRNAFWAGLFCFSLLACGCASAEKMVVTDPPGANLIVNGEPAGTTPIKYNFDFSKHDRYDIDLTKDSYLEVSIRLNSDTEMANQDQLVFNLEKDPSWDDTAESPAANKWLQITISSQYKQEDMWKRLIASVTRRYSSLETQDESSGYVLSLPIIKTYKSASGEMKVRTSFVGTLESAQPLVYRLKIVSERQIGPDRWVPWHRIFKEDEQLIEELQDRLGLK